jgi:hypothetical protein
MAKDISTPSTKNNHAVGDNAFLHNNAAKGGDVAATLHADGSVTIDVKALLGNDPGSATFVGLLNGKSLISAVGGVSFFILFGMAMTYHNKRYGPNMEPLEQGSETEQQQIGKM